MIIKITNGEVEIKDIYTRKTKKEYNKALSEGVEMNAGKTGTPEIKGFGIETVDKANDSLLLNMVNKITLNGVDTPVSIEAFDEMNSADVDKILDVIDKMATIEEKKN